MQACKVIIAGGSGYIGQLLVSSLCAAGYSVTVLTRNPAGATQADTVRYLSWNGRDMGEWAAALEGAGALINLSGKNVNCRLNRANRAAIRRSRIEATGLLCRAVRQCALPPGVFVQAGAVGFYGNRKEVCREDSLAGDDFLAETCYRWERAFDEHVLPATRKVLLRIGPVLGCGGGALPPLVLLTKMFLGGAAGNGRQGFSWIHESDLVRIVRRAVESENMCGVYNAVAPNPVTNGELMKTLRRVLKRPWSPPVPGFVLRPIGYLMGLNTGLALGGQLVVPSRLIAEGFNFEFYELERALGSLLNRR